MTPRRDGRRQRGVVLLIVLIGLLLMMIGAVAMVRSFNGSSQVAGNLAFRRDLTNQGERGLAAAAAAVKSGALAAASTREADQAASNYSAKRLETNADGIPLLLLKESLFDKAGMKDKNDVVDEAAGVHIRWIVDRQCDKAGAFDPATCAAVDADTSGSGTDWMAKPSGGPAAVYRVSVRVDGPRATQAFLQATFTY
jgi:Tfp pilus assembly protein PilX